MIDAYGGQSIRVTSTFAPGRPALWLEGKVSGMRLLTNLVRSAAAGSTSFVRAGTAAVVAIGLAACQPTATPTPVPSATTLQNPADVKYYPSDEPVKLGIQRFYEGNFGLAQQYFQDAVEKTPKDATAWVGLAASYDRLGNSILPIAAMRLRLNWSVPLRTFSMTRDILICCAES